jgi:hypothetical protein
MFTGRAWSLRRHTKDNNVRVWSLTHEQSKRIVGRANGHHRSGVKITTRQLAKCEWNLELASNFLNLLSESFFPANWVLFLPDSEIQTHIWHGDLFIIMTHTVYFSSRPSTDSAHCTNAQQRHDFGKFFSDLASKNFESLENLNYIPADALNMKLSL